MPVTTDLSSDPRYRTPPGEGWDGVMRVSVGGFAGTGALLYDGRAVLTAAHLLDGQTGPVTLSVLGRAGSQTLTANRLLVHPEYDVFSNNDLALLWLDAPAPVDLTRYALYRDDDEIGREFRFVGVGRTGIASTGASETGGQRLVAGNRFDADADQLTRYLSDLAWTPRPGTQLIADFDTGSPDRDALGQLIARPDLGLGRDEGLIAPGDSGGPAFLDGRLAGVASYLVSLSRGSTRPDPDGVTNATAGEVASWQRVSAYQQWIDQSLRAAYADAPSQPSEVVTQVAEGDQGVSVMWFLVRFTGERTSADAMVQVDYRTRDGTATAGEDYLAASGTLRLYPNETYAVIPVEVIGDRLPEPDETVYLDIFNPLGGSFGGGRITLTAVRTLLDNDGQLS